MLHINTPIVFSDTWRSASGESVRFKMDALQPSGSFKLRGVGLVCERAADRGARSVLCASGGNAGFAVAYAAKRLELAASIVVPTTTSSEARDAIGQAGAQVLVHGNDFDAADEYARLQAAEKGAAYVHPFDDPTLWDGHATLIDEVVASGVEFDCVVTSVGGGGLMLGIIEGLKRNGLAKLPVLAVETAGAASLSASICADRLVALPAIESIATSLGARSVAAPALAATREHEVHSLVVSDADALLACRRFADAHRVLVEPACGAAIAALDVHSNVLAAYQRPLVEVCGGIGVSLDRFAQWSEVLL